MTFHGDKKAAKWLLLDVDNRLKNKLVPLVSKSVETYHLTLSTLLWSTLIILFSFLSRYNIHFLWVVSAAIFAQYITDLLDGEVA